jgi:homoaconitate hydratase
MENYDPEFAARTGEGDVLVGGWNFGTGSSREQAVTSLQAKGLAMVIAASYSQTYLRNAFNNGFPCVQSPGLVAHIKEQLAGESGKTIIPGDELLVDFSAGVITWRGESFRFPPLGAVPQGLVVAGGVENQVRQKLAAG